MPRVQNGSTSETSIPRCHAFHRLPPEQRFWVKTLPIRRGWLRAGDSENHNPPEGRRLPFWPRNSRALQFCQARQKIPPVGNVVELHAALSAQDFQQFLQCIRGIPSRYSHPPQIPSAAQPPEQ